MEHQLFQEVGSGLQVQTRSDVVVENEQEKTADHRGRDKVFLKEMNL